VIKPEDDIAIRNLVATCAAAVGARDLDAWSATWSPEGVWRIGDKVVEGIESIAQFMAGALERFPRIVQTAFAGLVVEGEDGRPTGVWPVLEIQHVSDTDERIVVGEYRDVYTKDSGRWLFAERSFAAVYRGAADSGMQTR
jgi:hypothetical protein